MSTNLITQQLGPDGRTAFVWADQPVAGRRPTVAELAEGGFSACTWVEGPVGARNLLLLLHGIGDSCAPFERLARRMALPETSALALRAPLPLPAGLGGFMWFPSFDATTGDVLPPTASGLAAVRRRLGRLVSMLERCGWPPHRVFLFGFSQGGVVALDFALRCPVGRLGGVVSVCGHLPPELAPSPSSGAVSVQTPILVVAGTHDERMSLSAARRSFEKLRDSMGGGAMAVLAEIDGKRHEMIGSEAEARRVMQFFSEHLELHVGALESDPSIIRVR